MKHGTNSYSFSVALTEEPIATYALFFLGVGWGCTGQSKKPYGGIVIAIPRNVKTVLINLISYILHQPN